MSQLETWYREHGPGLLAYLRRAAATRNSAEDLLHETFVQALRHERRVAAAASPRAWLFAIARHVRLTAARRLRPASSLPADLPATSPESNERIEDMRAAIAQLPEIQREALELRLRHEMSYEEIADVLDIPVGTVRSRLHHAVRRLREDLAEQRS